MFSRTTDKSIFYNKETGLLLGIFFVLRILSAILINRPIIQAVIVFAIIMIFGAVYFKSQDWAWYLVLAELFLGGDGHMFEFFGLSIRSALIMFFLFLWIVHAIADQIHRKRAILPRPLLYIFIPFTFFVILAIAIGIHNGNSPLLIIQNIVPFLFFLTIIPMYHTFKDTRGQEFLIRLFIVFILGNALLSVGTFIWYSSGLGMLQDGYYHWFRDIAGGKITNLGAGFFRIVLPEHLLLIPAILLISSLIMRKEHHNLHWRVLLFSLLIILALDISRTFILALLIGLLVLKYTHEWKKWLAVSAEVLFVFVAIFTLVSFMASGGQTIGWNVFGTRFESIVQPSKEISADTRATLLTPIITEIEIHPWFGSGFGSVVTFLNPLTNQYVTTPQFDWGYLQLWVELGIFGLISFLAISIVAIYRLMYHIQSLSDYHDFYVGLLAGVVAFLVMTVTMPALFHVFGTFFLVFVLTIAHKPITTFDKVLTLLYRVFNKNKLSS